MALDNVLKIYDEQGNPVDYDILASDVKFNDGKDLPTKLDDLEQEIGEGGYTPPQGGIPATDLAPAVQTSLGKADTAYQKPASGIPATDLADGVIPDTSNLATKTEVNTGLAAKVDKVTGKGLSTNDYTDADKAAVATIPSKANAADIPEKVSDLENDEGFITAAALADVVVGSGDFAMTYDQVTDTYNIVRLVPTLQVTPLSSMSASTKSGTFKVSGTNLKGDVTIALPQGASNWLLSTGGGAGASSLTLSPTNGTLAETIITVAYSGSTDSVGNTITISSTGAENKTVTANYTVTAGPTIFADATKTVTAIAGSSATTTIEVTASQLTEGITVIKGGTNATKFNVTPVSLGTSGGTLTVQFSPDASDTSNQSATITLRSSGADDVVITLTGQVLVPSLTITPASLSLESDNNVADTGTINVKGTNIVGNVDLTISGSGFSLSANSLAAADVNSTNGVDVTVTANIASGTTASATITATSGQASATASASWTKTEPAPAVGDIKTIDGIHYKITEAAGDNTHGKCKVIPSDKNENTWSASTYTGNNGVVVIPDYITVGGKQFDVVSITRMSFYKAAVSSITLGQNITSIGEYAFNQTGISSIVFPSGLSALANQALIGCNSLTSVTLLYNGVVTYNSSMNNNSITIYVPAGLAASYRAATGWKDNSNFTFAELSN